jgi:hypothetical protein
MHVQNLPFQGGQVVSVIIEPEILLPFRPISRQMSPLFDIGGLSSKIHIIIDLISTQLKLSLLVFECKIYISRLCFMTALQSV